MQVDVFGTMKGSRGFSAFSPYARLSESGSSGSNLMEVRKWSEIKRLVNCERKGVVE